MDTARFGVLTFVGPSERDLFRTQQLLNSISHYQPGGHLLMVDDWPEDRHVERMALGLNFATVKTVRNPRNGPGAPKPVKHGIITCGMVTGMKAVREWMEFDFVLRIDNDALVINPFADKIRSALHSRPRVGMLGSCSFDCNGNYRHVGRWAKISNNFASIWARDLDQTGRWLPFPVRECEWRVRRHVRKALRAGWTHGTHCLGGAYALRYDAIASCYDVGCFDRPMDWLHCSMSEDVVMSMFIRTGHFGLGELSRRNEVFGMKHIGLPDTPHGLIERGYSIIHSVKNDPRFPEDEIYELFRGRRDFTGAAQAC